MGTSAPYSSMGGSQLAVNRKSKPKAVMVGQEATTSEAMIPPNNNRVNTEAPPVNKPNMASPRLAGALIVELLDMLVIG